MRATLLNVLAHAFVELREVQCAVRTSPAFAAGVRDVNLDATVLGSNDALEHREAVVFHGVSRRIDDDHANGLLAQSVPNDILTSLFWGGSLALCRSNTRLQTPFGYAPLELAHHLLARLLEAFVKRSVKFQDSVIPGLSAPHQALM